MFGDVAKCIDPPCPLAYVSLRPECAETIVLIQGAFSNPCSWSPIAALLPIYHVLVVLLSDDYNLETTSNRLGCTIWLHAHDRRAHIVAFSLGTHFAIRMMSVHPDLVRGRTAFISGYNKLSWGPFNAALPYAFFGVEGAADVLRSLGLFSKGSRGQPVAEEFAPLQKAVEQQGEQSMTMELCKKVMAMLGGKEELVPTKISARILFVAALKGVMLLPTMDNTVQAKQLAKAFGNPGNRVVGAKDMVHPWPYSYPDLFAESVKAWIEEKPLPSFLVNV